MSNPYATPTPTPGSSALTFAQPSVPGTGNLAPALAQSIPAGLDPGSAQNAAAAAATVQPAYYGKAQGLNWSFLSSAVQFDAQAAYADYLQNFNTIRTYTRGTGENIQPLSPQDWVSSTVQNLTTPNLLNLLNLNYEQVTGQAMDAATRAKVAAAMEAAPDDVKAELRGLVLAAAGDQTEQARYGFAYDTNPAASAQKAIQGMGFIQNIIGQAEQTSPAALQQQRDTSIQQSFMNTLGRMPTDAELTQLRGQDPQSWQQYIDQSQYRAGMTYGQYQTNYQRIAPQWQQWFGKDPGNADVKWAMGRTDQEIQARIDASNSRVPGINIGQYRGYSEFADAQLKQYFGYGMTDRLASAMHDALK